MLHTVWGQPRLRAVYNDQKERYLFQYNQRWDLPTFILLESNSWFRSLIISTTDELKQNIVFFLQLSLVSLDSLKT